MNDIQKRDTDIATKSGKVKKKRPFHMNYKTYESGPAGSPNDWRAAFESRMGADKAREILKDSSPRMVLGLDPKEGSWEAIKKAYRHLVFQQHPDRGGDPKEFIRTQAAYELLCEEFKQ